MSEDADIYAPMAAEANERADKIVKQILDEYVLETTAQGNASLFDVVGYGTLAHYDMMDVALLGPSLAHYDMMDVALFGPSLAPAWPSMCVTHRVLASEPELPRIVTTTRVPRELLRKPYKPRHTHKATTRAGKQHRIKGAR